MTPSNCRSNHHFPIFSRHLPRMHLPALLLPCLVLLLTAFSLPAQTSSLPTPDPAELKALAREVAGMFNYYDEISTKVPDAVVGPHEIGGQCGDYALAFALKWNEKHPGEAFLVIQQQNLKAFPDGIYRILGKDTQALPFLKNRTLSMLYIWNGITGLGHPQLGGWLIELEKDWHVKSHFSLPNWEKNGPHVWVRIGDVAIDPTYADFGTLPVLGVDE